MNFKIQPFSLIDAPGSTAIVFFNGCNLACPMCYNLEQYFDSATDAVDEKGVIAFIRSLVMENTTGGTFTKVDYVTFSGGECTIQINTLLMFLKVAKECGLKTAVYTNGCTKNTDAVLNAIRSDLINALYLDYKWPKETYIAEYGVETWKRLSSFIKDLTSIWFDDEEMVAGKWECWHLNTTILRSVHNFRVLSQMRKELSPNWTMCLREDARSNRVWTIENFYNDNGKIKTLGDLPNTERFYSNELASLLIDLQSEEL
jgi:organic radical activating enzyme